jgi:hypothetical protein
MGIPVVRVIAQIPPLDRLTVVGEQPVIPQAVSPPRFEAKPGVLATHHNALVVIEQLEGSHVNVRD